MDSRRQDNRTTEPAAYFVAQGGHVYRFTGSDRDGYENLTTGMKIPTWDPADTEETLP